MRRYEFFLAISNLIQHMHVADSHIVLYFAILQHEEIAET